MDKQLTANFRYSEFWCNGIEPPTGYYLNILALAKELQKVRDAVGSPITITSGWRSKEHNTSVGGATNSQHLTGKAADIKCYKMPANFLLVYLARYGAFTGFGVDPTFNHVDIRTGNLTIWHY